MATGDPMGQTVRTQSTVPEGAVPDGTVGLEYHGRRYRLLPQPHHAWAVVDRKRCVGIVELACPHIGDDGPRFAAKRVGEERTVVDGWTNDWRLAVEWLVDQDGASRPAKSREHRT